MCDIGEPGNMGFIRRTLEFVERIFGRNDVAGIKYC